MSLLKDSAIFKSSGMFLLQTPSMPSLPTKDALHMTNSHFFSRPSSRGTFNPQQIQQQQQTHQAQFFQKNHNDRITILPQINTSHNESGQGQGSRKNSLLAKNMNAEQLKDWLIGKSSNIPNADTNQSKANSYIKNTTQMMLSRNSDSIGVVKINKTFNTSLQHVNIPEEENAQQPKEQVQERQAIRRTQRRAQSDIILQRNPKQEVESQPNIQELSQQKNKSIDNQDTNDIQNRAEPTRIVVRKRVRMPSFNPTTVSIFEMQVQQKQSTLQSPSIETKQPDDLNQLKPPSRQSMVHAVLFTSPNKQNRITAASAESSPIKPPSTMETSQIGFNRQMNIHNYSLNGTTTHTPSSSTTTFSSNSSAAHTQSQRNLTQRQILLKDLQNITDSRKLLEMSSTLTPLNTKFAASAVYPAQHDSINQQIGKKLNIFNSPLSMTSSPIDEITSSSISSPQTLPLIKNRKQNNSSLSNIDNHTKLQLHPSSTKSSVIQSVWGSSSSFESEQQQIQTQPKGILKNKNERQKLKKSVVFDKKLQIHELDAQSQA